MFFDFQDKLKYSLYDTFPAKEILWEILIIDLSWREVVRISTRIFLTNSLTADKSLGGDSLEFPFRRESEHLNLITLLLRYRNAIVSLSNIPGHIESLGSETLITIWL